MRIFIYVQPEAKETFWTKQTQKAIAAEILRKRHTAVYLEGATASAIDLDAAFAGEEKRILLYVGTSLQKTPLDLAFLAEHGVHIIRIHSGSDAFPADCSRVLLNYQDALEKAVHYLTGNGHDRIALFGVNPYSHTDMEMKKYFSKYLSRKGASPQRDIYYSRGSIADCYANFFPYRAAYNAVICVNDMAAVTLLHRLKKEGVRVPEDIYLISCGLSSVFAEHPSTAITTVSADRDEISAQAVFAYATLLKANSDVALTLRVAARLTVRASTNFDPIPWEDHFVVPVPPSVPIDYFADPATQNFYSIESLLHGYDEVDSGILSGLLAGESYSSIAEKLFTSRNMVSYRVKRMCRLTGCSKKEELITLLRPYLE